MAKINGAKDTVNGKNEKEVEKAVAEPIKAKSITVDPNGVDIRELPQKDYRQIMFDLASNNQLYAKHHQMSLTNIELYLAAIVEKMYGEDADKVVEKLVERKIGKLNIKTKPNENKAQ